MFQNYFKIAWRNLVRNRAFSAINIAGLALGLATCLLISLFVLDELSFDRFHQKADRIVRVVFRGTMQGGQINEAHVMPPVARTLKTDYPEVEEATRIRNGGSPRILVGNQVFFEESMAFVDSNFFRVFSLPLIQGDPATVLSRPNTVVLTQAAARKYFGAANPIGKVFTVKDRNLTLQVTGLMEAVPANSHFRFDLLASMGSLPDARSPSWMMSEFFTYLVLAPGADPKKLEAKLPQVVEKYMGPQIQQGMGMSLSEFRKKGNDLGFQLQPLTDIHLHSDFAYDLTPSGDIRYVYIFGVIALFMMLIACINFMNLSTATASRRAREVGIRKVLGSMKWELVRQFLLESVILTSAALLLAVALVRLALPLFNDLSGKTLTLSQLPALWLTGGLLGFGALVSLLAGGYPAFFLSSFRPVSVLKGGASLDRMAAGGSRIGLRSALVVFQFFISISLMVGTTVVYQQLDFIRNKKLGYEKEQVMVVSNTWALGNRLEAFRSRLEQDPRVVSVSNSGYLPAGPSDNNNFFVYPDGRSSQLLKTLRYDVDDQYIPTLGMKMTAGRNFSREFGTDSAAIVINETAARTLGWGKNALGHTLSRTDNEGRATTYRIIGIVKDFHFRTLHEPITPLVMVLSRNTGAMIAKVRTTDLPGLLADTKKQWDDLRTDLPFQYSFLDERFRMSYQAEQKIGRILGLFAGLTIFVACLGLFGLATFTARQRTKEIGVRKVLGASVAGIVTLLSKDFLKLVLIALGLASPLAWWVMNLWLQEFAYKITIEWWMFALAGLTAVAIALLTVSFQSIKAALINPVKSLRSE
ncbi:ABC transporter permease [Larkinella soli]|uniref:ABC transporter permease n=1 Tax=Larkinella soli TaxID=1770527 RepID=UPI000FFC5008|nr:ABC transporter permease [Larkinella soli]